MNAMTKINKILLLIFLEIGFLGYTVLQEEPNIDANKMKATLQITKVRLAKEQCEREQRKALKHSEQQQCNKHDGTIIITASSADANIAICGGNPVPVWKKPKLNEFRFNHLKQQIQSSLAKLPKNKTTIKNKRNPYFTQY